jgi:membrane associated rhomboid family serine protease
MIAGISLVLLGAALLMSAANLADTTGTEKYILISLAASMIGSSTAFFVNSEREKARIIIARAMFSGVSGLVLPIVAAYYSESVSSLLTLHAIMVFGASFFTALVAFLFSLPVIRSISRRAPKIVDEQLDRWTMPEPQDPPTDIKHAGKGRKR